MNIMKQRISCAQLNKVSSIMLIFAKYRNIYHYLIQVNQRQ